MKAYDCPGLSLRWFGKDIADLTDDEFTVACERSNALGVALMAPNARTPHQKLRRWFLRACALAAEGELRGHGTFDNPSMIHQHQHPEFHEAREGVTIHG